jgi:geranylgeranyl pyrophosphate synthase
MTTATAVTDDALVAAHLHGVQDLMVQAMEETSLKRLLSDVRTLTGFGGKMLRSRLAFRMGTATGADPDVLLHGSAAVEMIHTASLLHDDVIDGGLLRRGMPSFWVEKGSAGAILVGDLLLFKAIDLMCRVADGRYTHDLVKLTGEVCEAESEQELMLDGSQSELEVCQSIARRKTGALFAFAAMIACGNDPVRSAALKESGYLVGTVYQLADDLLDAREDAEAGKTLGTDEARGIVSAAKLDPEEVNTRLDHLLLQAKDSLKQDKAALQGLLRYLDRDLEPAIEKLLG